MLRLALSLSAAVALAACGDSSLTVKVGAAELPQAEGTYVAPAGPTMILTKDGAQPELPTEHGKPAKVVRIAADNDVPWLRVYETVKAVRASGAEPVLLVGVRNKVRALVYEDKLDGRPMQVTVTPDAEFCVWLPGADNAACVKGTSKKHISSAHVREYVRQGVTGADFHDVLVWADPTVSWADMVRAVDGARTCCTNIPMRVAIADPNKALK